MGGVCCPTTSFEPGESAEKAVLEKTSEASLPGVRGRAARSGVLGAAGLMDGVPLQDKLTGGMALFIIDPQIDFHEGGNLAVPGAKADSQRIIELIERCGSVIERIVVTLDTHHAMHIHHKHFWVNAQKMAPEPFTVISKKDIADGKWRARFPEHQTWAASYVEKLEQGDRFPMIIWPEHCLLGTEGHAVYEPLMEALNRWAFQRQRTISWYFKGLNNNVEMYSALKAEVPSDHDYTTTAGFGEEVVRLLATHEKVICCGEALSHCVNNSVRDLEMAWPKTRSRGDIVVLEDGASPVAGFEEAAKGFLSDMKAKGLTVCKAAEVTRSTVTKPASNEGPAAIYSCRVGAAGLANGIPAADTVRGGAALLIIDPQQDFHPGGSLGVQGATADSQRIARFLKQNKDKIERVVVTLDTHHLMHIHHPDFWVNSEGKQPSPFTIIEPADVEKKVWQPRQPDMASWALTYVRKLQEGGRFQLQVWPKHCLLGTRGHAVERNLMGALNEWAIHRGRSINWLFKGLNNRTEMYSAFKAEVPLDDDPQTQLGMGMIGLLARHNKVFCCGEALSHCVNHSVRDLVSGWPSGRSKSDIVVLQDCASPVRLPDGSAVPDGAQFLEWAKKPDVGLTVVDSSAAAP